MGIVAEPTLFCDYCKGRIEPGSRFVTQYESELVRVENPSWGMPLVAQTKPAAPDFFHVGCDDGQDEVPFGPEPEYVLTDFDWVNAGNVPMAEMPSQFYPVTGI